MFVKQFFRFTYNRLFFFVFLLFVSYIYRSFPLLFSLFVSSFPVIACTALLLGLLLSFGNPNFPENESDCIQASETLPLLSGFPESVPNFVDTDNKSFTSNNFVSNRKNFSRKSSEEVRIEGRCIDFSANDPLILKKSDDLDVKDRDIREDQLTFNDDDSTRNQYIQLAEDTDDLDLKLEASSSRASLHTHGGDLVHSPPGSLHSADPQEEDGASSNASIDNVIPILDELHPLLDLKASLPQADLNGKGFTNGDSEALDHSQNEEKEEGEEDDEEEDSNDGEEEEEEDAHDDKENDMKPRIPWTEDDQKNVMDLGTSELERNQRLENLIARRRLRKQNIRLMAERNLIDLDSTDLNFPVAAISTGKLNPFDFPCDSLEDSEFDLMPGSAPSVLLPRRNPFDIPYDSNEEKPDLKGDSFHQDSAFHPKDTFFRRYESFTTRPSSYTGPPLHERGELKPKYVFPGENMSFQGGNNSNYEKTTSLVRDPKLPLVEEIESHGSETDVEDESGVIQTFSEETEIISGELIDTEQVIQILEADDECEEDAGHGYSAYEPDTPEFIVESAASSPKEVCEELVMSDEEKQSFSVCCDESPPFLDDSIGNHVEMSNSDGNIIQEPVYDLSPTANVNRAPISSATISESQPGPTTDAFVGQNNDEDVASGKGSTFEAPESIHSIHRESSEKILDPDVETMVDNDGAFLNEGDKIGSSYTEIPSQYLTEPGATTPCLDEELPARELTENCVTKEEIINSSNSAIETDVLDDRKQLFSSPQYLEETENGYPAKDIAIIDEALDSTVPQEGDEVLLNSNIVVDVNVEIIDNTSLLSSSGVETGEVGHETDPKETGMGLDQMER